LLNYSSSNLTAASGRYKDISDESAVISRREIMGNGLQVIQQETKLNPTVILELIKEKRKRSQYIK